MEYQFHSYWRYDEMSNQELALVLEQRGGVESLSAEMQQKIREGKLGENPGDDPNYIKFVVSQAAGLEGQGVSGLNSAIEAGGAAMSGALMGRGRRNERDTDTQLGNLGNVQKVDGKPISLPWLSDNYSAVQFEGTVKVSGETRDVSRRVYQKTDIDWDYVNPKTGLSNKEWAKLGNAPIGKDGHPVELHHTIQAESGPMVELNYTEHKQFYSYLHGLAEDGRSFRNNSVLDKQYKNFKSKYWRWRANQMDNSNE